jgi:fumarate reductase subunit D
MARRWAKPEFLFFGGVFLFLIAGLFLELTGIAPRAGSWIAICAFGVAWVPALLAIVLIVIPAWWRHRKAG